jgi:hypothetical protein
MEQGRDIKIYIQDWNAYRSSMVDEVYAGIPFYSIDDGREFVLKFNGLFIWSKVYV